MRSLRPGRKPSNAGHARPSVKVALLAGAVFGLLIAATGFTQLPPQNPPTGQESATSPPLRVMTRLVQVNVIVQDKNGNPVKGLTKDDFTLLDGGHPQRISYFAEEATRIMNPSGLDSPGLAAAPNLFTNRYEEKTGVPTSVTVILLDALNTHFNDMSYARTQVAKFLKQLQPQDRIALYGLSNRLTLLHDFTSDASSILRAIGQTPDTENSQLVASESADVPSDTGDADFDSWLNGANQRVADFFNMSRADETAAAIEDIANHLAALPGRKNLIWVSASFPFSIGLDAPMGTIGGAERHEFTKEVEDAAEALNNANMAIYPVDARGLIGPPSTINRSGPMMGRTPPKNTAPLSPPPQNFDTMNVIADRTGGHAYYNSNDIAKAVREAIDDSRDTYVIGYYPSHNEWNGKFREIKVQSAKPGVRLRFRRGYFAIPDSAITESQRGRMMSDAIHTTLESTDLGLDIQANPVDVPGARQIKADVKVDAARMNFKQDGAHWTDNVELVWLELDATGRIVGNSTSTLRLNVPQQAYEELSQKGVSFSETLDLKNDAAVVRLVARDSGTGAIGSVNIPIARLLAQGKPAATPK
jgi:VWFA-related protein